MPDRISAWTCGPWRWADGRWRCLTFLLVNTRERRESSRVMSVGAHPRFIPGHPLFILAHRLFLLGVPFSNTEWSKLANFVVRFSSQLCVPRWSTSLFTTRGTSRVVGSPACCSVGLTLSCSQRLTADKSLPPFRVCLLLLALLLGWDHTVSFDN